MPIYECTSCQWVGKIPHFGSKQKCKNCEFNFLDTEKRICASHDSLYGYGGEIIEDTKVCDMWSESLEYFEERHALADEENPPTEEQKYVKVCPRCGQKVGELFRPTDLAEYFGVSKMKVNPILSQLGMIQQTQKGWVISELGESLNGKQIEWVGAGRSSSLVCWHENILTHQPLVEIMDEMRAKSNKKKTAKATK